MAKQILYDDEARLKILEGLTKLSSESSDSRATVSMEFVTTATEAEAPAATDIARLFGSEGYIVGNQIASCWMKFDSFLVSGFWLFLS